MNTAAKADWLIPTALLALGFVPMVAGALRLVQLGLGVEVIPDNARFFAAVLKRDIPRHLAWMTRGYAIGLGAGTQAFTHLPWFLFPSIQGETARALFMGAGWAINLAAAEWLISRERRRLPPARFAAGPARVPPLGTEAEDTPA